MIHERKFDLVIIRNRYVTKYGEVPKVENGITKNVDELLDLNKDLQARAVLLIIVNEIID